MWYSNIKKPHKKIIKKSQDEIEAAKRNDTWDITDSPEGDRLIEVKAVYETNESKQDLEVQNKISRKEL